jgi:hypothetical protein
VSVDTSRLHAVEATIPTTECFLCAPAEGLVYAESGNGHFFAMLGLGPVTEGYSLIATREHVPSMLDVPSRQRDELVRFTCDVRSLLSTHYGPSIVTEHGRVAPCLTEVGSAHAPHCFHAHRLVFPSSPPVSLKALQTMLHVATFDSFVHAARAFRDPGQYLYLERDDDTCELASVFGRFPRQFFRGLIASATQKPELADWQRHPRPDVIEAARARLRAA